MNEIATEVCDPVFGHDGKMSKGAKVNKSDITSGSYVTTVTNTSESDTVNPVHTSSSPKGPCVLRAQNHRLFACDAFPAKGPQERFGVVKNYKLCLTVWWVGIVLTNVRNSQCVRFQLVGKIIADSFM